MKHLSTSRKRKIIDSVSSGERTRNSLNLMDVKLQGVVHRVLWGSIAGDLNLWREEILFDFSGTVWKDRSKRVIVPYVKESSTSPLSTPSITR